jgi:hypothetical protein
LEEKDDEASDETDHEGAYGGPSESIVFLYLVRIHHHIIKANHPQCRKELDGVIKDEDIAKIRATVSADLAEVMSAPKDEGFVNWDFFARSISTPGIVETIKQNYIAANKADDELLKQDVRTKYLGGDFQDLVRFTHLVCIV